MPDFLVVKDFLIFSLSKVKMRDMNNFWKETFLKDPDESLDLLKQHNTVNEMFSEFQSKCVEIFKIFKKRKTERETMDQ